MEGGESHRSNRSSQDMSQSAPARPPQRSTSRRRNVPSLSHLRLAPLSSHFALEQPSTPDFAFSPASAAASPDAQHSYAAHHSSYIQGRSAPTTPGILSRSSSRKHLSGGLSRRLSIHDADDTATPPSSSLAYYTPEQFTRTGKLRESRSRSDGIAVMMPKAKSDAAIVQRGTTIQPQPHRGARTAHPSTAQMPNLVNADGRGPRHHRRARTTTSTLLHPMSPVLARSNDDWLTRAGLATSTLLRESKGQSWLASRASSTSLLSQDSSSEEEHEDGGAAALRSAVSFGSRSAVFADDEFSPETPRASSRWGSRFGSRVQSAKNSRRGSWSRTPGVEGPRGGGGYFDQPAMSVEPDFVDVEGEAGDEDADEEEVARLARQRNFGLGGLVDRLVGWSMFSLDEDREASETEASGTEGEGEAREDGQALRRPVWTAARPLAADAPRQAEEGGWQEDAAWLLSVASKVLL